MTVYTDVDLCARALVSLGADPIQSFDDGTAEAEVSSALYVPVKEELLLSYPWHFNTQVTGPLGKLTAAPDDRWSVAYQVPSEVESIVSVNEEVGDFDIYGKYIVTDYDGEVFVEYQSLVDESKFPPYFSSCLIAELASRFCIPITEDATRSERLGKEAERLWTRAKFTSSRMRRNRSLGGRRSHKHSLIAVR